MNLQGDSLHAYNSVTTYHRCITKISHKTDIIDVDFFFYFTVFNFCIMFNFYFSFNVFVHFQFGFGSYTLYLVSVLC